MSNKEPNPSHPGTDPIFLSMIHDLDSSIQCHGSRVIHMQPQLDAKKRALDSWRASHPEYSSQRFGFARTLMIMARLNAASAVAWLYNYVLITTDGNLSAVSAGIGYHPQEALMASAIVAAELYVATQIAVRSLPPGCASLHDRRIGERSTSRSRLPWIALGVLMVILGAATGSAFASGVLEHSQPLQMLVPDTPASLITALATVVVHVMVLLGGRNLLEAQSFRTYLQQERSYQKDIEKLTAAIRDETDLMIRCFSEREHMLSTLPPAAMRPRLHISREVRLLLHKHLGKGAC